jgi:glucose/arabinose dehydrogenase
MIDTAPQDLTSLAGKVLRIDPATGGPGLGGNSWGDTAPAAVQRVWTYGHHGVQGIALQPETDEVYLTDPGSSRGDEIEHALEGADHGYDPAAAAGAASTGGPERPGGGPLVWSSGDRLPGVSGLAFLEGEAWGSYDDLLVAALGEDAGLLALQVDRDPDGQLRRVFRVPELAGSHGRLRTARAGSDGVLNVLTANGGGADQLLRVTPSR